MLPENTAKKYFLSLSLMPFGIRACMIQNGSHFFHFKSEATLAFFPMPHSSKNWLERI